MILQLYTLYAPPLRTYITFIISQFLSQCLFHIIPSTKYHPHNPRDLPHSMPLLTRDIEGGQGIRGSVVGGKKKRGRPSQIDQAQKAERVLSDLEEFLNGRDLGGVISTNSLHPPDPSSLEEYLALKEQLKKVIPPGLLESAEETTLRRVEAAEEHIKRKNIDKQTHFEGLERLRQQIQDKRGLLCLVGNDTVKGKEKEQI